MIKYKYDVYLAGAMHGRMGFEVLNERDLAKYYCRVFGLTYYDPADDEQVSPHAVINLNPSAELMDYYIQKDDNKVDQCAVLLNLTGDLTSSGTSWEMGRMYYLNHRPIVLVAPKMYAGKLMNYTTRKATAMAEDVKSAVMKIHAILTPKEMGF